MKRRAPDKPESVRNRIIAAGARILAEGGREALTTRAVATAARIQAPTIYRLFGDKDGLLNAVAEDGLARYIARKKAHAPKSDPLEELRLGWDMNVEFGLEHPAIFWILSADPSTGSLSRVAAGGLAILQRRVNRVAAVGLHTFGGIFQEALGQRRPLIGQQRLFAHQVQAIAGAGLDQAGAQLRGSMPAADDNDVLSFIHGPSPGVQRCGRPG